MSEETERKVKKYKRPLTAEELKVKQANKKQYDAKRIKMAVSFNPSSPEDNELLALANELDFGPWVKGLLREAMQKANA